MPCDLKVRAGDEAWHYYWSGILDEVRRSISGAREIRSGVVVGGSVHTVITVLRGLYLCISHCREGALSLRQASVTA
jgi:hypothetical protein